MSDRDSQTCSTVVQEVVTHFIISYYIKWVTTSWTHSLFERIVKKIFVLLLYIFCITTRPEKNLFLITEGTRENLNSCKQITNLKRNIFNNAAVAMIHYVR